MKKQEVLRNIESEILTSKKGQNNDVSVIKGKRKFFVTFPFPYMNGKLHWGHAYTLLKADFEARYKQLCGYNVLFPFGYHCTGIPIHAAAKKLENELDPNFTGKKAQHDILRGCGIEESELSKFKDPNHWISVFPPQGQADIRKLGVMIDHRRSFVTTSINPFYDSFIKWQINKLHKRGYLKFGTRPSIFSEALNMQCQDHDRSFGEGIQSSEFILMEIPYTHGSLKTHIWVPHLIPRGPPFPKHSATKDSSSMETRQGYEVTLLNGPKYNIYYLDTNNMIITTSYLFSNWQAQNDSVKVIKVEQAVCISTNDEGIKFVDSVSRFHDLLGGLVTATDTVASITNLVNTRTVSLTSDLVVDRLGTPCIIKPVPQWYIDYSDPEWKGLALKALSQMRCKPEITAALETSINWLKEWGVSRTFGLGTSMPFAPEFVIESLSDSTIYPAYYTIAHMLHNDLYGHDSSLDPTLFTEEVWDYIFWGKDVLPTNTVDRIGQRNYML